jgi:protein-S-isoprenylcysteine O-methyltransferase Ste14
MTPPALAIFGLVLLLGFGLDAFFHTHGFGMRRAARMDIAFALALSGIALSVAGALGFAKTKVDATDVHASPKGDNADIGTFALDPIYLSANALYAAVCLAANKPIALALLPAALAIHFNSVRHRER